MFGDITFGFDPQMQGLYKTTGRVFLQKLSDQEQYDFDFMGSDRHGESNPRGLAMKMFRGEGKILLHTKVGPGIQVRIKLYIYI